MLHLEQTVNDFVLNFDFFNLSIALDLRGVSEVHIVRKQNIT